eukprot:gene712-1368_t
MPQTLLARTARSASFLSAMVSVVIHLLFRMDQIYSASPLCNAPSYSSWIWFSKCFSTVAFLTNGGLLIFHRLCNRRNENDFRATMASLTVMLIAGLSGVLEVSSQWGGICEDPLGVRSSATQAAEWTSCVPLIIFTVIAFDNKDHMSKKDSTVIILSFLAMLCTVFVQISMVLWVAILFLTLGLILGTISMILLNYEANEPIYLSQNMETAVDDDEISKETKDIRFRLRRLLIICMPSFPIVYFLAASHVISDDICQFLFVLCNLSTKLLFSAIALENHIHIIQVALITQKRGNEARRAFMRFIMHDVRVPLNSITMGIDVLSNTADMNDVEMEALLMMREASMFMSDTLNSVLDMQKIEEGKLQLIYSPFLVKDVIQTVSLALKGTITQKGLQLKEKIDPKMPKCLTGDKSRIEHVLANLLSNSLKFSPRGGIVTIKVELMPNDSLPPHQLSYKIQNHLERKVTVMFSVTDEGPGSTFSFILPLTSSPHDADLYGLKASDFIVDCCSSSVTSRQSFSFGGGNDDNSVRDFHLDNDFDMIDNIAHRNSHGSVFGNGDGNNGDEEKSGRRGSSLVKAISFRSTVYKASMDACAAYAVMKPISKVLLTDDVVSNRRLLKYLLQHTGIECDEAEDGVMAVAAVQDDIYHYDMVFMDNQMPNMNGMDAAKAIRKIGYDRLIIGLTGTAMDDEVTAFLEAGVDIVLIKPMKADSIKELLKYCKKNGNGSSPSKKLKLIGGKIEVLNDNNFKV